MNPRVVFFGTPDFVIPVVSALYEKGWLAGVVTAPDKKIGRKQILTPTPIKKWALQHQIPVFTPDKFDQDLHYELITLNSSLFVLAAYGHLLPQSILDIPRSGVLNIHPSLLPKYRGPSPIQNSILNGDKVTGVTIIKMDEKMDHGSVIITNEIRLSDQDTCETLSKKLFEAGAELLIKITPDFIEGKIKLTPQNDKEATFTHLVKKEDGYFDINNPPTPKKLDKMIRAFYPWPNAWTKWGNKIVKFLPLSSHPELVSGSKKKDSGLRQNDKFLVQMEGKKPVSLEEFLRGYSRFPLT